MFALAVVSLACWVSVLTAAVDAARVFNETGLIDGLTRDNIQFYSNVYRGGVAAAQIGASMLFAACGFVAIIGTKLVELPPPVDNPGAPD